MAKVCHILTLIFPGVHFGPDPVMCLNSVYGLHLASIKITGTSVFMSVLKAIFWMLMQHQFQISFYRKCSLTITSHHYKSCSNT